VGWLTGRSTLLKPINLLHGFMSFCAPRPLQIGIAKALKDVKLKTYLDEVCGLMEGNARLLAESFQKNIGVKTYPTDGGYFLVVDCSPLDMQDKDFLADLALRCGIVGVPMRLMYNQNEGKELDCKLTRFAICKDRNTIMEAVNRLQKWHTDKN